MANINNNNENDLERALAVLSLEHEVLKPELAVKIIENARRGTGKNVIAALRDAAQESVVLAALAKELKIMYADLASTNSPLRFEEQVLARADMKMLKEYSAIPYVDKRDRIVVAVANPLDARMTDYLKACYPESQGGFSIVLASRFQIQTRLEYYLSSIQDAEISINTLTQDSSPRLVTATKTFSGTSTQNWVESTLIRAVAEGASDVHFLFSADDSLVLRFRIDGVLRQQGVPSNLKAREIIGTVLNRCDTIDSSNTTIPQDGTFSFVAAGRQIDARVAMLPQASGPTVVIRLLDSINMRTRLEDMGFSNDQLAKMRKAISLSRGTILVCGPTGAGKSTTLYGLLREVDAVSKSVYTVENPVEYRLPLIGQTEVRENLGDKNLTFARVLRSILRLDPDIILVGEIRDEETAGVAMQAALTGHLVLSTIHSNSAVGAYSRLVNMKVPSFIVSEAVSLVIAQRLLRRVHDCARFDPPNKEEVTSLIAAGIDVPDRVAHIVGCDGCKGTGYRGRLATVEVLSPNREIREMVISGASADLITDEAKTSTGFVPLLNDGERHMKEFRTTVSEMLQALTFEEN